MSFYLSLFDVTGIQSFIFSSRKAAENVGGSLLVQRVFDEWLLEAIADVCRDRGGRADVSWKEHKDRFYMPSDEGLTAEVIYIGGGNAMVAFRDREAAVAAARKLSKRLVKETDGALGVAVAHVPATGDFAADNRQLHRLLDENKFCLPNSAPVMGLGVTREGSTDGLPAVKRDDRGLWISAPADKKRKAAEDTDPSADLLDPYFRERFAFPREFDNLGRDKAAGESFIAVVHIDGNSMGKNIKAFTESAGSDYDLAVANMRQLSAFISSAYKDTFSLVLNELITVFDSDENPRFRALFPQDEVRGRRALPVRPLIFAGDDVTFVCDGRIAIDLTTRFLEKIVGKVFRSDDGKFVFPFTACGGIAIVKPHFPFWRAYELAESLCSSAKKRCKAGGKPQSCWFDYQIVYSGLPTDLKSFRASKYTVPGAPQPKDGFNLMWRPYCVSGTLSDADKTRLWSTARTYMQTVSEGPRAWPRSKLKGLREALCSSREETELFCSQAQSRGDELPVPAFEEADGGVRSQWYDILELLDSYIPVPVWHDERGRS